MGNVKKYLASVGDSLPRCAQTPITTDYRPEVDITHELSEKDAAYFHSLIGMLRWIVELGHADICLEV